MNPNLTAFLDLIAHSEGTDRYGDQNGYNVLVGGKLFDSYADHPNILVNLPKLGIDSTAAGRYQILHRYWVTYKAQLKLPDFSPDSQDKYVFNIVHERNAYDDVLNGDIKTAIEKCRSIWASLPGANYPGQHMNKMEDLLAFYQTRLKAPRATA